MTSHIVNQIHHPELSSDNTLHVVAVISNVERYHSRYRLAREWIEQMKDAPNVKVHLVEAAFGDRQHELLESVDSGLSLRINTNAWVKENMFNLGVRHLVPRDFKYVACFDADVQHRSKYWAQETLHQLQHFHALQPWQHCVDLGPHGSVIATHTSFGFVDQSGVRKQCNPNEPYQFAHPGFAWAFTRAFWEQTGGLIDTAILGSGDSHMAWAMIGEADSSIHFKMSQAFRRHIYAWQAKAVRLTHGEVGFSVGRLEHSWHGSKAKRYYRERWQILVDNDFNPDTDLMRDSQGVLHVVGKPKLEADIRKYNRSRLEDSIDP